MSFPVASEEILRRVSVANVIFWSVLHRRVRSTRGIERIDDAHEQTYYMPLHALQLLRTGLRDSIRDSREQPDRTIRELLVPLAILLDPLYGMSSGCAAPRSKCAR
jgi:hypothetical protein